MGGGQSSDACMTDLLRFHDAQASVYSQVAEELRLGKKRSHWMWFIFPQLQGLGRSETARRFAIRDLNEARRYLADPVLGERLRNAVQLLVGHDGKSANEILGSPDDMKFRSCLTLFKTAATEPTEKHLFQTALDKFYGGEPDPRTLELLDPR